MLRVGLYLQAALYLFAGINHFWHPEAYMRIMPPWVPAHAELVFISGILEAALGILLIFNRTRRFAAWGIIVLLIAVFPANIQMLLNYLRDNDPRTWIAILRLPIQLLLLWWAWLYTRREKIIS